MLKESSEHNSFLQNSDGVPYERYIDDAYNLAYSRNEFKDVEVINKEEKDKDLQNTPTETKKGKIIIYYYIYVITYYFLWIKDKKKLNNWAIE